jgi:hypothetical protein
MTRNGPSRQFDMTPKDFVVQKRTVTWLRISVRPPALRPLNSTKCCFADLKAHANKMIRVDQRVLKPPRARLDLGAAIWRKTRLPCGQAACSDQAGIRS